MKQAPEDVLVHGLETEQKCHGPESGNEPDDGTAQGRASDSRRGPEGGQPLESLPY